MKENLNIWREVPEMAIKYAKLAKKTYDFVKQNENKLPEANNGFGKVWYNPEAEILYFNVGFDKDLTKVAKYKDILQHAPNINHLEFDWTEEPNKSEPWLQFHRYSVNSLFKSAEGEESSYFNDNAIPNRPPQTETPGIQPFKALAQLGGWRKGITSDLIGGTGGNPTPVSAMIGSGLLGAGLGYGTGWLLEHLISKKYMNRGRLRKTLGILGGLGAAVPGALWGVTNVQQGLPFNKASCAKYEKPLPEEAELNEFFVKSLQKYADIAGGAGGDKIDVDAFNEILWNPGDPFTPPAIRAGASGLVTGAGEVIGSNFITPKDIARVAVGAGAGYVSGSIVGKTLGALAGLTPPVQEKLQQIGTWSGVLKSIIPSVLGKI